MTFCIKGTLKFNGLTYIHSHQLFYNCHFDKQIEAKERGQAVAVMGANISAATSLASISLVLCSLIGTWIGSSNHNNLIIIWKHEPDYHLHKIYSSTFLLYIGFCLFYSDSEELHTREFSYIHTELSDSRCRC